MRVILASPLDLKEAFRSVRAVIFDFDGTLAVLNIDFGAMRSAIFELLREFSVDEETIKERYLLEIIEEVYPLLRSRSPSVADAFYKRAHQALEKIEFKAAEQGRIIPGVDRMLQDLRVKGLKVGIVTRNCEEAVRRVFPAIRGHCDVFLSRNSIKNVKPHPDHLLSAMKALRVSGGETVIVGDHTIDIRAGKAVGMKTIGVLTGRTKREEFEEAGADYVLDAASDIIRLLGE